MLNAAARYIGCSSLHSMNALKLMFQVALLAMMCAEGMRVAPADLGAAWKHPSKIVRGVIAVIVLVPIMAALTTFLLRPLRPVALGLAFLAAAPLAPIVVLKLAKSGESFRVAMSLHVALACLSVFTAPLVLMVLGRVLGFSAVAPPAAIAGKIFRSLLLPFGLGVALHAAVPRVVQRIQRPLERAGTLALFGVLAALMVVGRHFFAEFGVREYAAMALFCGLSLACGHFMAAEESERTTYALESATRNPAIALLMATSSIGPVRGAVVLPYLAVSILMSTLYSKLRKRGLAHPRPSFAP